MKNDKKYIIEKELIELCKIQIIRKAGFGDHHVLSHKDIEYLCFVINEKTKINLSVSTLKRIWKNEYNRIPQDSTLDALARFIDYESWNAFKKASMNGNSPKTKSQKRVVNPGIFKNKSLLLYLFLPVFAGVLTTVIIIRHSMHPPTKKIDTKNVLFKSYGTISAGVPNTVVFEYNVDDVNADSFFIQHTWDTNRRARIQKHNYFHTEIYYYPDYHVAKLIADTTAIKELDIDINTDGWLPFVTYDQFNYKPIYLKVDSLIKNGVLSVSFNDIQKYKIDFNQDWYVHFRNTGVFKRMNSDNFTLKTRVRVKKIPFQSCPRFYVMINCRDGYMKFPLVKKGCESIVDIRFNDLHLSGENYDLSFTGCDLEIWQEIIIRNIKKEVAVFLNGKKIFQNSFSNSAGTLAGFDFYFNCIGEIDYVSLYDADNQLIYEDRFENTKQ